MKRFLNENKVLIMNVFLLIILIFSYFVKFPNHLTLQTYLKTISALGLICSIINWFALQILLDKLSFLYTLDKIREYLLPIKNFLIRDVFGAKDFNDLKKKYGELLSKEDKDNIENNIYTLGLNNILKAFDSKKTKEKIKKNILNKIFEIEDAIKLKIINGVTGNTKEMTSGQFFKQEILPIIENKLELSILTNVQSTIYSTIKNYFEWLVIWGGISGAIAGVIFRFIGCL